MDLIDGLRAFVATAQTSSFTEAAERMGVSNRLTSKYVAELETRIGARLLQRTTRKVGLTSTGQDLLARAPALLDELDDMLGSITEESKGFSGTIRISAPVTSARVTRDWATEGRGIAYCPDFVLSQHLADGRLVRVLEDFDTQSYPIAAMYLEGNVLPRKVRALIDFALEDFQTSSH